MNEFQKAPVVLISYDFSGELKKMIFAGSPYKVFDECIAVRLAILT